MSSDEDSMISLEEVNQALAEIENKYSPVKKIDKQNDIEEELLILSKVRLFVSNWKHFSKYIYINIFRILILLGYP